jgi:hypothetical protein
MDSLITAGGRALASGDALGALNCIALRDDPPALALRGLPWPSLAIWPKQGCLRRCHLHHERFRTRQCRHRNAAAAHQCRPRYARAGKRHSRQTCIASLAAEVESEFLAKANDRFLCNSDIATHGSDSMAHSCSLRLRECAICLMGAGMPAS